MEMGGRLGLISENDWAVLSSSKLGVYMYDISHGTNSINSIVTLIYKLQLQYYWKFTTKLNMTRATAPDVTDPELD
jgi:hypothetical protein